jgi:hypothetical protein
MNPTFPFNKIVVELTAQDCADAVRGDECFCVVATAMDRLIPSARRHEVTDQHIRFSITHEGKTYRIHYSSPPEVVEYIRAFDAGEVVGAMTFTLENPTVVEKDKAKPKGAARTPSKPSGKPQTRRVRVFGAKTFQKVGA